MPTPDEPLPTGSDDEIEEISADFIIGEATSPAVPAPSTYTLPAPSRPEPGAPPVASRPVLWRQEPPAEEPGAGAASAVEPSPARPERRRDAHGLVAFLFLALGAAGGFFVGVQWERRSRAEGALQPVTAATSATDSVPPGGKEPGRASLPEPGTKEGAPGKSVKAPKAAKQPTPSKGAPSAAVAKGKLSVTAPAGAEVYLDGKRIGRGSLKRDVAAGRHRIEVRLGKARTGETFDVEPNETWTYDVTPTR
jgi:hypothetical protein